MTNNSGSVILLEPSRNILKSEPQIVQPPLLLSNKYLI